MSTTTITICDVMDCSKKAVYKQKMVSVVFTTEQDEGRTTAPYLSNEKLDFCSAHYQQYIANLPIWAMGAMGHNEYAIHSVSDVVADELERTIVIDGEIYYCSDGGTLKHKELRIAELREGSI